MVCHVTVQLMKYRVGIFRLEWLGYYHSAYLGTIKLPVVAAVERQTRGGPGMVGWAKKGNPTEGLQVVVYRSR